MDTKQKFKRTFYVLTSAAILFAACQKDQATTTSDETSSTIAVAATLAAAPVPDSVYLVQKCGRGGNMDSVAQADLPATATAYLDANYAGYTFHKAFAIKSSSDEVTGYVAVIYYNNRPVGVEFDANGTFVRIMQQHKRRPH